MEDKDLIGLLEKYRAGTIGPEEWAILESWYNHLASRQQPRQDKEELDKNLALIAKNLPLRYESPVRSLWPRIAAAASIILCLATGGYFLLHPAPASVPISNVRHNDIEPGGNKAILTLAGDQKIVLTEAQNGRLAQQPGVSIDKTGSGEILYRKDGSAAGDIVFNTIAVPRGGKYRLTLADGTRVWLNAASSITYPTSFAGAERGVRVTGEAYFEVASDAARPFRVFSKGQTVEVLGTHFDINSYEDEPVVCTTLLEGSIKVVTENKEVVTLKPGQQANRDGNRLAIIRDPDLEGATAWKNGVFHFSHSDIRGVMRQLSRWYDVGIEYQGQASPRHFSGDIHQDLTASQALDVLSMLNIHFRIEGRKIIVIY